MPLDLDHKAEFYLDTDYSIGIWGDECKPLVSVVPKEHHHSFTNVSFMGIRYVCKECNHEATADDIMIYELQLANKY